MSTYLLIPSVAAYCFILALLGFQQQSMTIDWKPDHDLVAKHPRKLPAEDDLDSFDGDIGSFFHLFTDEADILGVGSMLLDVLSDPLEFFTMDPSGEDSDFEDDDDEEGSIDLGDDDDEEDQPDRKKQKKA